jgi:pectinesterase
MGGSSAPYIDGPSSGSSGGQPSSVSSGRSGVAASGGVAGGVAGNGGSAVAAGARATASAGTLASGGTRATAGNPGIGGTSASSGAGATAGSQNTAGSAGATAAAGSSADGMCSAPATSTSTRPQLTSADASKYSIAKYFAQAGPFDALKDDPWDPTAGLGDASAFKPDFTVAADGGGTHTTVQAALSAATGAARRYILLKPGTYRELVSYSGSTPVTIYGAGTDASQVVIIHNMSQQQGVSQTFTAKSNGMQIMNLTLSNDFATPASGTNIQALALLTMADKVVLQNVRLHGFQDTVQLAAPNATTKVRVYIKDSFIEGDTDYIYGNATVVIEGSTIHYLSSRKGKNAGVIFAPSTSVSNELGFLVVGCNFTADAQAPTTNHLGRSWDTSSTMPTPNGQAVIRESTIGGHIDKATPWTAAATSSRPYTATGNRFSEYCNTGPGAGP